MIIPDRSEPMIPDKTNTVCAGTILYEFETTMLPETH